MGEQVAVFGRIQSREYQKKISETEVVTKTAFEVSVSRIMVGQKVADLLENQDIVSDDDFETSFAI